MIEPLYNVPSTIVAGDYYELLLKYDEYPTSEASYTPNLYIRGASTVDVNGTVQGDYYRFVITSTQTSILKSGTYQYSVTVKDGTQRKTAASGWLTVDADLATSSAKISHAEKMITAIECVLEGRITDDVTSLSIAGRSISKIPIDELMILRANYYKELSVLKHGPSAARKKVPIVFGYLT